MSKDIKLNGQTYLNVSEVRLPLSDDTGFASFVDGFQTLYTIREYTDSANENPTFGTTSKYRIRINEDIQGPDTANLLNFSFLIGTTEGYCAVKIVGVSPIMDYLYLESAPSLTLSTDDIIYDIKVSVSEDSSSGGVGDMNAEKYIEGPQETVNLPNITSIKKYAFYKDTIITSISMPNVTTIDEQAFNGCSNLSLSSLPEGLTSIGEYAFSSCGKLRLSSLPAGITSIGSYAFQACTGLTLTSLPEGIPYINTYTFSGCTNLALTSLPEGITSIGNNAFYNCTSLALTSIPAGVTSIGSTAFYNCTGLTTLTFKGKPNSINSSAFKNCTNLTEIRVPWAEGEVNNAPWGATYAKITYNYTGA